MQNAEVSGNSCQTCERHRGKEVEGQFSIRFGVLQLLAVCGGLQGVGVYPFVLGLGRSGEHGGVIRIP